MEPEIINSSDEESKSKKVILVKDTYNCSKCNQPPKFLSIKNDSVQLKCLEHGVLTLPIQKYLEEMTNYSYYNYICDICKKNCQKGFLGKKEKIFKYCFDCNKKICHKCAKKHKEENHEHIFPCNTLNDRCSKHLGEEYTLYCTDCQKNICMKCNSEEEHKTHKKELLSDIEPSREELKKVKKKREEIVSIQKNLESQLEKINSLIFLFDNIVNTFQEHKTNYNYIENINDLLVMLEIKNKDKEIENLKRQIEFLLSKGEWQEEYIEELNKKYNAELSKKDIETEEMICLNCKNIDNDGLKLISKINLKSINILHLGDNKISDIGCLSTAPFRGLKELYLFGNEITNIDCLENFPFKRLEKLSLGSNYIEDISVLSKVPFRRLKVLELWENNICNIDVLGDVPFKKLKELSLSKNQITNLDALTNVSLRRLEKLSLHDNFITNIDVLTQIQFKRVQRLYIENNNVDYSLEHNQKIIEELKNNPERDLKY